MGFIMVICPTIIHEIDNKKNGRFSCSVKDNRGADDHEGTIPIQASALPAYFVTSKLFG
jgi:hypothetical protein